MKKLKVLTLAVLCAMLSLTLWACNKDGPLDSLEIVAGPTQTVYTHGDTLNRAGLQVKANFTNSKSRILANNEYEINPTPLEAGMNVMVRYGGKEVQLTGITVNPAFVAMTDFEASIGVPHLVMDYDDGYKITPVVFPANATRSELTFTYTVGMDSVDDIAVDDNGVLTLLRPVERALVRVRARQNADGANMFDETRNVYIDILPDIPLAANSIAIGSVEDFFTLFWDPDKVLTTQNQNFHLTADIDFSEGIPAAFLNTTVTGDEYSKIEGGYDYNIYSGYEEYDDEGYAKKPRGIIYPYGGERKAEFVEVNAQGDIVWTPFVGGAGSINGVVYNGIFDGRGFALKNWIIHAVANNRDGENLGTQQGEQTALFHQLDGDGVIKNLAILDYVVVVNENPACASLVAVSYGTLQNIYARGILSGLSSTLHYHAPEGWEQSFEWWVLSAGLVGRLFEGSANTGLVLDIRIDDLPTRAVAVGGFGSGFGEFFHPLFAVYLIGDNLPNPNIIDNPNNWGFVHILHGGDGYIWEEAQEYGSFLSTLFVNSYGFNSGDLSGVDFSYLSTAYWDFETNSGIPELRKLDA
ncbi:MAG: hypothetical protein FWH03_05970 [Firmicutes bacterium]|nr:hypothetical protein [Bacillota bacterium]